jgi:hypothetical protein
MKNGPFSQRAAGPAHVAGQPQRTIIEFHALGLDHGKIDKENGIIHGVSLITAGIEARGHDLHTDDKTLEQICSLANEMGQVPVKWNHKTGADAINGYLCNFFVTGNKVKSDWHLLTTHPQFLHALELAERMPGNFGLSTAFLPADPEARDGKKFARCEELISVDLVAQPAANPGGLFEAVDIPAGRKPILMDKPNAAENQDVTLADVLEAIKGQNETIAGLQGELGKIQATQRKDEPLSIEELNQLAQLDDATLAQYNLTREEVDSAVADAMNGAEDVDLGPEGVQGDVSGQRSDVRGQGQPPSYGVPGGNFVPSGGNQQVASEVMSEMADLRKRVTRFERQQTLEKQAEEAEAIDQYFNAIEEKVVALEARNQALETAFTAGGGSVAASGEFVMPRGVGGPADGSRNGPVTEFEDLVNTKVAELSSAADGKKSPVVARAEAIRFVQANNRDAYTKHLETKGVGITFE